MKSIDIILLTGPSHSGKSTIANALGDRVRVLRSDTDVMERIFCLWPDEETRNLKNQIGRPKKWEHLRGEIDFDEKFRFFHCNWLSENDFPAVILADGWIYSKRHWREQVFRCLEEIPDLKFTCHLWVVKTTPEEFHRRYMEKEDKTPKSEGYKFLHEELKTNDERIKHSRKQFDEFIEAFEMPLEKDRWYTHFKEIISKEDTMELLRDLPS